MPACCVCPGAVVLLTAAATVSPPLSVPRPQGDSELVIRQMRGEYHVNAPGLVPYHEAAKIAARYFQTITYEHIPRSENSRADAQAKMYA